MFKNYLKIAARNLLKNRLSTIINVVGLATAVGCGIVVFLFIDDQYGRDAFHENAETIFFVESLIEREGRRQLWGFTPAPLGPSLAADFPQIKRAVRVNRGSGIMRYQDKVFEESLLFAEAGFFDMLTFPLKHGNAGALADPRGIFLGAELAQKYFGEDDPTGKQVTIRFREDRTETFTVAGVAEPFPQKASFAFDVLMPYQVSSELSGEDPQDWKNTTGGTFIQVNLPQDIDALKTQMHRYIERNNLARPDWPVAAYVFDNLLELSLNGWKVRGRIAGGTPPMGVPILLVIGALLMLLACFNHVNIAIASAGNRLTEIGVRKTMGGKRGQLIKQFLCESVLLCMIALVVGVALAQTLFVPGFNSLFPFKNLSVDFFDNLRIWLFFLGLLFLTGVVAGAYPAFYISRFQPAAIIRGKQKLDGRSRFSKFLLAFQFVLAALLTVCGIVFTQNVVHQSRIDLGYSQSGALVVPINNAKHFTLLRDEIAKHAEVVRVAGAGNHIGRHWQRNVVTHAGKKYEVAGFTVNSDYLEAMKFRLQTGRTFDKNLSSDFGALVVNERFVQEMSWQNAIGQYVNCDSVDYTVIGVVEDFHYADFRHKIEPAMFRLGGEKDFRYLIVETEAGKTASVAEFVKATWKTLIPDLPYEGFSQELILEELLAMGNAASQIFAAIAMIALVLSCMGLFGLVSLHAAKRRKEFSIRKVLGAGFTDLARLISRQFVFILAVALALAIPVSYLALNSLLNMLYVYRVALGPLPFALMAIMIFLVAATTVASRVYQVVTANPVEGLRHE